MPAAFAWYLALRYLLARKVTWLGVGGITVAVWALITVIAVFSGFIGTIRDHVRNSAPDLIVTDLPHDQSYRALRPAILAVPGVAAAAPRLRHYGTYHELAVRGRLARSETALFNSQTSAFVQLLGIDPVEEAAVTPLEHWLREAGAGGAEAADTFAVARGAEYRGRRLAKLPVPERVEQLLRWPALRLGYDKVTLLQPGEPVEVLTAVVEAAADGDWAVNPAAARFAFAGTFKTGNQTFDERTALLPIQSLRTLLGHDPDSDGSIDLVTDVAVRLLPGADPAAVAALLAAALRPLLPPGQPASVLDWEQQNAVFLGAVEIERALMKIVLLAVMLIAAFLIYATLHMMVMQKVKDLGILGALGGSPRSVGSIFVVCGVLVGAIGCLCGATLGGLSTIYLNPILDTFGIRLFPPNLYDLREVPARLDPWWVLQVSCGAFALALLVAWLPARRAARLHPVVALSYE